MATVKATRQTLGTVLLRALLAVLVSAATTCKADVSAMYLQGQMPKAEKSITAYGTDLFGDKHSLYDGSWSIEHTDLDLRGNNALPVALARSASHSKRTPGYGLNQPLGDWSWLVPRIGGTFSARTGWKVTSSASVLRCSQFFAPPEEQNAGNFGYPIQPTVFWHGVHLDIPGAGRQEVLRRVPGYTRQPQSGGPFPLVTKGNWQLSCLPQIRNGAGEGFEAISPEGVRYRFDWMSTRTIDPVRAGYMNLGRQEVYLHATEVTDRFGNWVRYAYDPANPAQLTRIQSKDQRQIDIQYNGGKAAWASDGTRTVQYGYGTQGELSTVTLPDATQWKFGLLSLMPPALGMWQFEGDCDDGSSQYRPEQPSGWVIHPTGARLDVYSRWVMLERTGAPAYCAPVGGTPTMEYPPFSVNLAVVEKRISHPTLPATPGALPHTLRWQFDYADVHGDTAYPAAPAYRLAAVKEPNGSTTRHRFGNTWKVNEGLALSVEKGWSNGVALQRVSYSYRPSTGQPYPDMFGWPSDDNKGDTVGNRNVPMDGITWTQQGRTFSWSVAAGAAGFDDLARPLQVTKSGPGGSRQEITAYEDRTDLWVLGQLKSVIAPASPGSTIVMSKGYDALAQLTSQTEFGVLKFAQEHDADGTLRWKADGANHRTWFSNYKRGIAQRVDYPTGAFELAVVNDIGQITNFTDAAGFAWAYGYDLGGHLSSITPPSGFLGTTLTFQQVATDDLDLGAGHWRQIITKGNAETIHYFDAFWRLRMTRTRDTTQEALTRSVTVKAYDSGGNLSFESYPQREIASAASTSPGKRMDYDALGRNTVTRADSELGVLTSTTEYLDGFQVRRTNPRTYATVESLWALDKPGEASISEIVAPEGVVVSIARDLFGKARSISRGGVTRSYVYGADQRLCKTIEPEVGATVQAYDDAGHVSWRAPGQALPDPNSCDTGSVPESGKISYVYDDMGQLLTTSYGDGSPSIARSYTPDGLLRQIGSSNTTWTYTYNELRKLVMEQYTWWTGAQPSQGWHFTWNIDPHGNVGGLTDPWGWIGYAPNALGQATQVSGYASDIRYHPNGAVASYTLNNGVSHRVTQNLRGLPEQWQDIGVVSDVYRYDENGNVLAVEDQQGTGNGRGMQYDGLDRLKVATGPWGAGRFEYDAADNLRYSVIGGRTLWHNIDANNRLINLTGSQNINFEYDPRGNVVQRLGQGFTFDLGNRLRSTHFKANHIYDGHGRRSQSERSDGTWRLNAYSLHGKLLGSYRTDGGATRHVYLGDKLIAETTSSATTYSHTDALGSPVARTNSIGALLSRTQYEPYGATAGGTSPVGIGFTGHVNDADTGLVYMQQRYYDPIAGRFLSVDPVITDANTGGSFGRYHYVENNPYKFIDPDGRQAALTGCAASPLGCAVGVAITVATAAKVVNDANKALQNSSDTSSSSSASSGSKGETAAPPAAAAGAPASNVRNNNSKGKQAENEVAADLEAAGREVDRQVRKDTPFGPRVIDIEVKDQAGNVKGGIEVKQGNSRYRQDQRAKDRWLRDNGYPVDVVRKP